MTGDEANKNQVINENSKHYILWGDFQTINLIQQTLTQEEYLGFLKGNILKYKLRDKGQDESDRVKANDYQRELNAILQNDNLEAPKSVSFTCKTCKNCKNCDGMGVGADGIAFYCRFVSVCPSSGFSYWARK